MFIKKYLLVVGVVTALLGGCAPKTWDAETEGAYDIFEPFNRELYKFNKGIDWLVLKPASTVYRHTPAPLQSAVGNVLSNAKEPINITNNFLQRKGKATINSVARFTFNTTIGAGGIVDIADKMGVDSEEADFGQTLRSYGLTDTTYIVLPLLGPSTVGDGIGTAVDSRLSPITYIDDDGKRVAVYGVAAVHRRHELSDEIELAESAGLDEYSFVRDIYEERRQGDVPESGWRWVF